MVVLLGEREAALPLRALQREFDIADESEDGRMLALIAASLDFVTSLRLGDALPAEVLSGEASWEPTPAAPAAGDGAAAAATCGVAAVRHGRGPVGARLRRR